MAKLSIQHITKSKSAAGLEIILLPDGTYALNVVVLKKEGASLVTVVQKSGITTMEEAAKSIDVNLPVVLLLNGKGIIHKKVSVSENDTPATLLNKVLPNAGLQDFCLQQTPLSVSEAFVSVVRSSVLNELLEELKKYKLTNIVCCLLGPLVINNLLPLIDTASIDKEQLHAGSFLLRIREDQIVEISNAAFASAEDIRVGDENINASVLTAFAAAMTWFTGAADGISNSETLNNLKEEYVQKKKFEVRGWAFLVSVFLLLTINYLVFNNYWTKSNKMNAELSMNQSAVERCDALKKECAAKKEFLEQNGLLENSRTSYYADRLAAGVPNSIQLTDLNIHPVKKKAADDESSNLFFENKQMTVSGKCQRSTELNDWIKELKQKSWIAAVVLVNYNRDDKTEDGLFLMDIQLK